MKNRRDFITTSGLAFGGVVTLPLISSAKNRIVGANDHIRFAVAGLNSRGGALIDSILQVDNVSITHLCDVDRRTYAKRQEQITKHGAPKAIEEGDFRRLLDNPDIDAVTIATPDHWHAPMAIMAAKAGKAVYVEKPCCYDPAEGELLVNVQKKYNAIIQMGNQQRSGHATKEAISDIRGGIIGTPYMGKAWYSNSRGSIGRGKSAPVPDWLDWNLFQGPAPREEFRDNIVHYNWHWFWAWGTGEINNNGTHEIDICRYALDVEYPTRVSSTGGRYAYDDDWEFYDTQLANFEFEGGKLITWEGRSCNPHPHHKRGRGVTIHGTKGTVLLDRLDYYAYDMDNKEIKHVKENGSSGTTDVVGGGSLTDMHMDNFANAIREDEALNADIEGGYTSNLLAHLGNIAQESGGLLDIDPTTGHIVSENAKAHRMWTRSYEPGWEPTL